MYQCNESPSTTQAITTSKSCPTLYHNYNLLNSMVQEVITTSFPLYLEIMRYSMHGQNLSGSRFICMPPNHSWSMQNNIVSTSKSGCSSQHQNIMQIWLSFQELLAVPLKCSVLTLMCLDLTLVADCQPHLGHNACALYPLSFVRVAVQYHVLKEKTFSFVKLSAYLSQA